jgi:archaellin
VVIIKKLKDIEIEKSIGKILRKYNILEYKSPTDYLSIDDYYKVKAYAYLYKSLSKGENSIDIDEVTITLTSSKKPKKLLEYLKRKGMIVKTISEGVYYLENTDIATQIVVTKEIPDEDMEYLKLLQLEHSNNILNIWIQEYLDNIKNPLYAVIMDVLAKNNPNELMEVYKNMSNVRLSEDNRIFLMDMMRKLELDKKLKDEGKIEVAKNLLQMGMDILTVIKATGLEEEEIRKIKEEMH